MEKTELLEQQKIAYEICEMKDPDKIIILGGDCSVEQAPFDYLHGKVSGSYGYYLDGRSSGLFQTERLF